MKKRFIITTILLAGGLFTGSALAATPTNSAPGTPNTTTTTTTSFSPQQVKDIQKVVHNYLVNNPQVLVEASQALQKQSQKKEQQFAQQVIQKNVQQLFKDPASPVVGNQRGTVTLVEFFDYQCGHCKAMNPIIQNIVKKNKNLRVVFKELPIFGSESQFAAKAALASVKQGKDYVFHDALLSENNPLTSKKVFQVAKKVGLNVTELKKRYEQLSYPNPTAQ